jgi:hypothetical protein
MIPVILKIKYEKIMVYKLQILKRHFTRAKNIFLLSLFSFLFIQCTSNENQFAGSKYRFIYNNDGTEILGNRWHNFLPLTIEDVHSYVDVVAQTPVTTFMICSGSMLMYYKSEFERPLGVLTEGDTYGKTNDVVLGENMAKYERNYKLLQEQGTDIIELCVNRAKEKGMEAFITMRMNDLHFSDPELYCPRAQSDIWLEHPEWRMGNHPGWHADGALNFAHEGVREYKLNLIQEQCELYDIDGIELDFMRFIVYFPYGKGRDYLDVMTDFVAKARTIVDEVGKKRGRPILLAVRVPAKFDLCAEKGLDIPALEKQKLIDMITISVHWLGDPALPVREFLEKLGSVSVPVYASIESGQYNPYEFRTHGMYRAVAAQCLQGGADGIYVFNFFFKAYMEQQSKPVYNNDGIVSTDKTPELLTELCRGQSLSGRNKLYTLSDGVEEYSYQPNTPLPLLISPWVQVDVDLELAENFQKKKPVQVLLFLRMDNSAKAKIFMNGQETGDVDPAIIQKFKRGANLKDAETVIVRSVSVPAIRDGMNKISVRSFSPTPFILKRVEMAVEYGDVVKYGYF